MRRPYLPRKPSKQTKKAYFKQNRELKESLPLISTTGFKTRMATADILAVIKDLSEEDIQNSYIQGPQMRGYASWNFVLKRPRSDKELEVMYQTYLDKYERDMEAFKKALKKYQVGIEEWRAQALADLEKRHAQDLENITRDL